MSIVQNLKLKIEININSLYLKKRFQTHLKFNKKHLFDLKLSIIILNKFKFYKIKTKQLKFEFKFKGYLINYLRN